MRIERKRPGKTVPHVVARIETTGAPEFDGYYVLVRGRDQEGREVRLLLERHEATHLADFIRAEFQKQRARVEAAVAVADKVLG